MVVKQPYRTAFPNRSSQTGENQNHSGEYQLMYPIPVAVALIIMPIYNSILLGRRMNPEEYGLFGFPGGKQNVNEKLENTLIREAKEETNLDVLEYKYIGFVDVMIHQHFLGMAFSVTLFNGIPQNMEPHKCMGWSWFDLEKLPPKNQWTETFRLFAEAGFLERLF